MGILGFHRRLERCNEGLSMPNNSVTRCSSGFSDSYACQPTPWMPISNGFSPEHFHWLQISAPPSVLKVCERILASVSGRIDLSISVQHQGDMLVLRSKGKSLKGLQ